MKKILILYNNAVVRELLAQELAADGHLVVPIEKLRLAKELIGTLKPDLVLLNMHMNGEEKWEVLEEIKKHDRTLPVLVFTDEQDLRDKLAEVYAIEAFALTDFEEKLPKSFSPKRTGAKKERGKRIQNNCIIR